MTDAKCTSCGGSGQVECQGCSGDGGREKVNDLTGTKMWSSCASCKGKGEVACKKCGGSGKVDAS